MVDILLPPHTSTTLAASELLADGEVVAVVDDSPEIVLLLTHYLNHQGIPNISAGSASEFLQLLSSEKIALVGYAISSGESCPVATW